MKLRILDLKDNKVQNIKYCEKRKFNNDNIKYFNYLLSTENWNEVYESDNTNKQFNVFLETFLHYFNMAFPKIKSIRYKC